MHTADFTIENHGSVIRFDINTDAALDYVRDYLGLADWQWLGTRAFAVDHRVAPELVRDIRDDGWSVE